MRNEESKLQQSCITWFRLQYPRLAKLLFAVPNGSRRDVVTGAIFKREGVVTGDPVDPKERLCQPMHRNEVRQERAKRKPERMTTAGRGCREQVCGVQVAGGVYEIY